MKKNIGYIAVASLIFLILTVLMRVLMFVPIDWIGPALAIILLIVCSVLMVKWTKKPLLFPLVSAVWSSILYIMTVIGFLNVLEKVKDYEPSGSFDTFLMGLISVAGALVFIVLLIVGVIAALTIFLTTTASSYIAYACIRSAEKKKQLRQESEPIEVSYVETDQNIEP